MGNLEGQSLKGSREAPSISVECLVDGTVMEKWNLADVETDLETRSLRVRLAAPTPLLCRRICRAFLESISRTSELLCRPFFLHRAYAIWLSA